LPSEIALFKGKFSFTTLLIHIGSFKVPVLPRLFMNVTFSMMCLIFYHEKGIADSSTLLVTFFQTICHHILEDINFCRKSVETNLSEVILVQIQE
jgi:hypothetical protein